MFVIWNGILEEKLDGRFIPFYIKKQIKKRGIDHSVPQTKHGISLSPINDSILQKPFVQES